MFSSALWYIYVDLTIYSSTTLLSPLMPEYRQWISLFIELQTLNQKVPHSENYEMITRNYFFYKNSMDM